MYDFLYSIYLELLRQHIILAMPWCPCLCSHIVQICSIPCSTAALFPSSTLSSAAHLILMLPMPQTPDPLLQTPEPTPPHIAPRRPHRDIVIPAHIRVLQLRILPVVSRDLHGIPRVERPLALRTMEVLVDVRAILHLDPVVVDFVGLQGAVQGEGGLGLPFEVFRVVVLHRHQPSAHAQQALHTVKG